MRKQAKKIFMAGLLSAPVLMAIGIGLLLLNRELTRVFGSKGTPPVVRDKGVVVGGDWTTQMAQSVITMSSQFMVLVALALPVVIALLTVDRICGVPKAKHKRSRVMFWVLASVESLVLLGLFVAVIETLPK